MATAFNQHPVFTDLINRLRNSQTRAQEFRQTIAELSRLLCYHALSDIITSAKQINTWNGLETHQFIDQQQLVIVPILRAGLPMLEGVQCLLPDAPNGFLAMKRDETTHIAKTYYNRIPDCHNKTVILVDPMLATGGSLIDAIELIKTQQPKQIISLNIIGAPEGLSAVEQKHPEIKIFIAQVDQYLNPDKFIFPGLGDAGDRAFNTVE